MRPHKHWRVEVQTSGEQIVVIETEMLGGREISEEDEETIRQAAYHLLSFIGEPTCTYDDGFEDGYRKGVNCWDADTGSVGKNNAR